MSVSYISNRNYKHNNLVNKPPYITNVPMFDYMCENNLFWSDRKLMRSDLFKSTDYKKTDKFMTMLYFSTIGTITGGIYLGYKKMRKSFNLFKK